MLPTIISILISTDFRKYKMPLQKAKRHFILKGSPPVTFCFRCYSDARFCCRCSDASARSAVCCSGCCSGCSDGFRCDFYSAQTYQYTSFHYLLQRYYSEEYPPAICVRGYYISSLRYYLPHNQSYSYCYFENFFISLEISIKKRYNICMLLR